MSDDAVGLCTVYSNEFSTFIIAECTGTAQPMGGCYLQHLLPDELVLLILSNLYELDLLRVAATCQRLCKLADDPELWSVLL